MTTEIPETGDEAQIRELIADEVRAFCAKDVDRIMSHYAPGAIIFEVKPPFQTRGADSYRRVWEASLPHFPDSFGIETRDLSVVVSGDLALAHWIWRVTGLGDDHSATQTWMRNTVCYQRQQGTWRIVHAHLSVPFDPHTGKAVFTLEP